MATPRKSKTTGNRAPAQKPETTDEAVTAETPAPEPELTPEPEPAPEVNTITPAPAPAPAPEPEPEPEPVGLVAAHKIMHNGKVYFAGETFNKDDATEQQVARLIECGALTEG